METFSSVDKLSYEVFGGGVGVVDGPCIGHLLQSQAGAASEEPSSRHFTLFCPLKAKL